MTTIKTISLISLNLAGNALAGWALLTEGWDLSQGAALVAGIALATAAYRAWKAAR